MSSQKSDHFSYGLSSETPQQVHFTPSLSLSNTSASSSPKKIKAPKQTSPITPARSTHSSYSGPRVSSTDTSFSNLIPMSQIIKKQKHKKLPKERNRYQLPNVKHPRKSLQDQYLAWELQHHTNIDSLPEAIDAIQTIPGTYYDIFKSSKIDPNVLIRERTRLGRYLPHFQNGDEFRKFVDKLRPNFSKIIYKYDQKLV
jgi:hypothetical protein